MDIGIHENEGDEREERVFVDFSSDDEDSSDENDKNEKDSYSIVCVWVYCKVITDKTLIT